MRKILFTIIIISLLLPLKSAQIFNVQNISSLLSYINEESFTRVAFAENSDTDKIVTIASPTNPIQDGWYSNQSAIFTWTSRTEATGVSIEFNDNPTTTPDFVSEGILYSKTYEHIGSGVWYFHLRIEDKFGWNNVFHYKIQIDRKSPDDFEIKTDNNNDSTLPTPRLSFETKDDLSGISHYKIYIDDKEEALLTPEEINPFIMSFQPVGLHEVEIVAVDRAGNEKKSFTDLEIQSISAPEISVYPVAYNSGDDILYLGGKSLPSSAVVVFLKKDGNFIKKWEVASDKEGSWSLYVDELFPSGIYSVSATNEDSRGAVSNLSEEHEIKFSLNGFIIGSFLIEYKSLIFILLLLIGILSFVSVSVYNKVMREKKKIRKETIEAELSLKKTFKQLQRDLEKKIEYFDLKPGLSTKEKIIRDSVFKLLKNSENIVRKEIKDIENEVDKL